LAQNVYECMFIFDSNAYARDPGAVSGRIPKMIEKCGGELLASRLWFEQRLAFPIKGQRKGSYWLSFFRMESGRLAEFDRECQLDDSILRHLTLKVDPRMAEIRISQASGEPVSAPSEPTKVSEDAVVPSEESAVEVTADAVGDAPT
jgi:small subunit ribosomal protein S6